MQLLAEQFVAHFNSCYPVLKKCAIVTYFSRKSNLVCRGLGLGLVVDGLGLVSVGLGLGLGLDVLASASALASTPVGLVNIPGLDEHVSFTVIS